MAAWIFLFLVPAVGMRLWAEERRTGTIELILTLPVTLTEVILGKFLAAWLFIGVALLLTFPLTLTLLAVLPHLAPAAAATVGVADLRCEYSTGQT